MEENRYQDRMRWGVRGGQVVVLLSSGAGRELWCWACVRSLVAAWARLWLAATNWSGQSPPESLRTAATDAKWVI
jgi:hypothetical protein